MPNRTKKIILSAFNDLIDRNDFSKISVRDICKEAEVSTTTFYRHFTDKYDVMAYNYQRLFDKYLFTQEGHITLEDFYRNMFRATQEEFSSLTRAFAVLGRNSLYDFIYNYSVEYLYEFIRRKNGTITDREKMQCSILAYGISYNGMNWVKGVYDLTPEEAASATYELMPEVLRGTFDPQAGTVDPTDADLEDGASGI